MVSNAENETWYVIASPNYWKERKAMKNYKCGMCNNPINPKDVYFSLNMSPKIMGMFSSQGPENQVFIKKLCVSCYNTNKKKCEVALNKEKEEDNKKADIDKSYSRKRSN